MEVYADPVVFILNDCTTNPDTVSTELTSDIFELTYPMPMDEDTVDSIGPPVDSQTLSTVNTNSSESVSRTT